MAEAEKYKKFSNLGARKSRLLKYKKYVFWEKLRNFSREKLWGWGWKGHQVAL